MNRNHFKIMLRNLWRNKLYSLINILGLGIGIAAIIWGIQNYRYAKSFDNFHTQRESVYRIISKHETRESMLGIVPFPIAFQAAEEFSSVKEYNRIISRSLDLKTDQAEAFITRVHFTEPSFFKLFDFPLISGNNNLEQPNAILITEKTAKKYFGNSDPLGKTITLYSAESFKIPMTVTGVLKDPPMNSSIVFELICHVRDFRMPDGTQLKNDSWGYFTDASFIKVDDPEAAKRLAKELSRYIPHQNDVRKDYKLAGFEVLPMGKLAVMNNLELESNALSDPPENSAALGPLVLAILILLSACLNFANTTVARSNKRLKEMGIRKVMGGTKAAIIRQQLFECAFIVLIGIGLSMIINHWWLPEYNAMFIFVSAQANYLTDPTLQLTMLVVLLSVTLISGFYPGFYISRYNPTQIFRGSVKFGGNNLFSRILLGFQIMIAFITVIASAGFYRNALFQKNYDYGYAKDNVFGIGVYDSSFFQPLYNEIAKIPGVETLSGTRHHIGFAYRNLTFEAKGMKKQSVYMAVGPDYTKTMQLKLASGRYFDPGRESDFDHSILITEKLAFQFGWDEKEALGKFIEIDTSRYTVLGVLQDFHADNLFDPMQPVALHLVKPARYTDLIVRTREGSLLSSYDQGKAIWKKLFPMKPFNGYYQDEIIAESTRVNKSITKIFFWFAVVSMMLTVTGFFALISLTLLKKMREIAIRKIVGASVKDIVVIMNKGYFWVFLGASVIGCYTGVILTRLLMNSIFRINNGVNLSTVWISFVVVLTITALTVALKVREAIMTKPVDVLKTE